jgi:fatty acid desaturase
MGKTTNNPNYSLVGKGAERAQADGLVGVRWYRTDVDKTALKALMVRRDGPAIRDTLIWFLILGLTAWGGIVFWGTIWCVPFFFVYGVMYGSAGDSRWHECGHGTAFKTPWMNRFVYQIACFMMIRNPVIWRWSHTRHHADTIIVGRDPEIAIMRPAELAKIGLNVFGILDVYFGLKDMVRIAIVGLDKVEKSFVPIADEKRAIFAARIWITIYLLTISAALSMMSFLPLMLVGLPRFYGAWHHVLTGLLQHGGLAENVTDHRMNTRTVLMNPISRFIYWNMNYHIEHHMFLMVPCHALPALHELVKHDLPAPNSSIFTVYRQMWPAILRQVSNEHYFIKPELPNTAKPVKEHIRPA